MGHELFVRREHLGDTQCDGTTQSLIEHHRVGQGETFSSYLVIDREASELDTEAKRRKKS